MGAPASVRDIAWQWMWKERAAIKRAPFTIALLSLFFAAILGLAQWFLIDRLYQERIAILETAVRTGVKAQSARKLTTEERVRLRDALSPIAASLPTIIVYADSYDRGTALFAYEMINLLKDININVVGVVPTTAMGGQHGVMVGVVDPSNPSEDARKFQGALRKAGFTANFVKWEMPAGTIPDFDLFIGPER